MFQNMCLVFFAIPNTCKTRTRTDVKKRQTIQTNREHSTSENRKTHKYTHTERTKKTCPGNFVSFPRTRLPSMRVQVRDKINPQSFLCSESRHRFSTPPTHTYHYRQRIYHNRNGVNRHGQVARISGLPKKHARFLS